MPLGNMGLVFSTVKEGYTSMQDLLQDFTLNKIFPSQIRLYFGQIEFRTAFDSSRAINYRQIVGLGENTSICRIRQSED